MEATTMVGKASGIYKEFLDNTRGEYERVMYGRKTTEELDILEETPEQAKIGEAGSIESPAENTIDQAGQEMDDDIEL